jgi:hypothetical protein
MEYNLRTVAGDMPRAFERADATSFCRSLPETLQEDCAFWIPQWMLTASHPGERNDAAFRDVGSFCEASDYPNDCFGGIGYFAAPFGNFEAKKARSFCEASTENPRYREDCWEYARLGVSDT